MPGALSKPLLTQTAGRGSWLPSHVAKTLLYFGAPFFAYPHKPLMNALDGARPVRVAAGRRPCPRPLAPAIIGAPMMAKLIYKWHSN